MTAPQHLRAALCLAAIALNLTFWAALLLVLLPAKAAPRTRPWFRRIAARIYRAAVRVDNVLLRRISRASWRVRALSLDPTRPHIVVSNHRSWADIFLVQDLVAARGPIVTFLSKRELLYVPIFGLIILAFDFPVLRRRTPRGADAPSRRADDRRRVAEAAAALLDSPTAILSFAEGTRFTPAKRDADGRDAAKPYASGRDADRRAASDRPKATGIAPRYGHLLPPRAGGLRAMIDALASGGGSIVDVTLVYPRAATFWQFLGGAAGPVGVSWEAVPIADVPPERAQEWLNDRWRRKDELLAAAAGEPGRQNRHLTSSD